MPSDNRVKYLLSMMSLSNETEESWPIIWALKITQCRLCCPTTLSLLFNMTQQLYCATKQNVIQNVILLLISTFLFRNLGSILVLFPTVTTANCM